MGQVKGAPLSISVSRISDAARDSLDHALRDRSRNFPHWPERYQIGFVPGWWWIGVVIESPQMEEVKLGKAHELAKEVFSGISNLVPDVGAGKPGVLMGGGHLTIGFAPPIEKLNLIEE
jgi:hypothetical protein